VLALLVCFGSVIKKTWVVVKTTLGLGFGLFYYLKFCLSRILVSFGVGT